MVIYLIKYSAVYKLEMWAKLLTKRKLLNTKSTPNFFSKGIATATFNLTGKIPVSNEMLIIFVVTGIRASTQDFSKGVGIGSRQQDGDLEFAISLNRSSSVSGVNVSINGLVKSLLVSVLSGTAH